MAGGSKTRFYSISEIELASSDAEEYARRSLPGYDLRQLNAARLPTVHLPDAHDPERILLRRIEDAVDAVVAALSDTLEGSNLSACLSSMSDVGALYREGKANNDILFAFEDAASALVAEAGEFGEFLSPLLDAIAARPVNIEDVALPVTMRPAS